MGYLYFHTDCLRHETGQHPECPARVEHAKQHLAQLSLKSTWVVEFPAVHETHLVRVHRPSHLERVQSAVARGFAYLDPDTVVSRGSWNAATAAAGAVVHAVDSVLTGRCRWAFCLIRPPGHHATSTTAMGFCLLNNVAIAAAHALAEHGLERVMIVDWDVHHGNGTQEIFYRDPRVMFLSIHRFPFYPGTGSEDERGEGPGEGFTINVPVRFGTPRAEYHARFRDALQQAAEKSRPQLILISSGFDAHREDPIGSLGLENDDFVVLTDQVVKVAERLCDGRLVSVLEGGYHLSRLAECIGLHVQRLETLLG
jgi:acetoin utilization deacetylase AcuC-like enzyme